MFIGAAGIALSHLPGLPMIAGAAMGIAAVTAAMLGLPLTAVLLTTVFLQADGLALTPLVIVSAVVAYVTAARLVPAPKPEPGQPPAADAAPAGTQGRSLRVCRWLAYSGTPVLLEEVIYKPSHSLIDQSLHSKLGARPRTATDSASAGTASRAPALFQASNRPGTSATSASSRDTSARELVFAHIRLDGYAGAADQLPSVPPRPLAVDAQRLDRAIQ